MAIERGGGREGKRLQYLKGIIEKFTQELILEGVEYCYWLFLEDLRWAFPNAEL